MIKKNKEKKIKMEYFKQGKNPTFFGFALICDDAPYVIFVTCCDGGYGTYQKSTYKKDLDAREWKVCSATEYDKMSKAGHIPLSERDSSQMMERLYSEICAQFLNR